jgi:hypothetical protein
MIIPFTAKDDETTGDDNPNDENDAPENDEALKLPD